jgi:tRNA(His) guanylyltransferase
MATKQEQRDALGARMKDQYEQRARQMLPRRTWTIVRLDGRAFHTYTRGLARPYDEQLMWDMGETAKYLCQQVGGCRFAYTQSDEISLLLTDFGSVHTQAWFDGNQQKITSITAGLAAAKFNALRPGKLAVFDSRAFTIPDPIEVGNHFVWRQQDATRNSIMMAAQAHFSHKQLHGKNTGQMQDMLWTEHGVNWNDYDPRFKRGTVVVPETFACPTTYRDRRTGETTVVEDAQRTDWFIEPAPMFTRDDWSSFDRLIPGYARARIDT